jgi:DNA-binding YbaB/EbfC family protein
MNIAKMLKQAQQMQQKLAKAQEELAEQIVEGSAGGGKVIVQANGAGEVLSLKIDPQVVSAEDVELLEDLILAAIKDASEAAKQLAGEEMGKITGGMNLPGLSL